MANTLKFGNGEWYGKKDTILAYNDENKNYKPLPFDFSRGSSATVVNKDGLIETVGSGEPRIDYKDDSKGALLLEPSRTNLITQSEAFANSYWTKSGASIQGDATTAGAEQVVNGTFATDTDWTKGTGWTISGGSASSDGTINTSLTSVLNVFEVGKTYKVSLELSNVVGSLSCRIWNGSSVGLNVVSAGNYEFYYSPNTISKIFITTLSNNTSTYSIDNVSVKEVQGFASPSGSLDAFKLVENVGLSDHRINSASQTLTANTYSSSFFAKKAERDVVQIFPNGSFDLNAYANFDLTNGVVSASASTTAKIEALSDGWYKCSYTFLGTTSNTVPMYISIMTSPTSAKSEDYIGDGTSGIYIYGAQVEQGSYPTSYIPTQGGVVTRLADSCSQTVPDGVIGQTEGTMYVEIKAPNRLANGGKGIFQIGLGNNRVYIVKESSTQNIFQIGIQSPSGYNFINTLEITNENIKFAIGYKNGDNAFYLNGNLISSASSNTNPTVFNDFLFFGDLAAPIQLNIKKTKLYNTRLSNSELAALTTI